MVSAFADKAIRLRKTFYTVSIEKGTACYV